MLAKFGHCLLLSHEIDYYSATFCPEYFLILRSIKGSPLFVYVSCAFLTPEKLTRKTRLLISKGGLDTWVWVMGLGLEHAILPQNVETEVPNLNRINLESA